jgi:hypothetical protein
LAFLRDLRGFVVDYKISQLQSQGIVMAYVVFWEMPGCKGNEKQQDIVLAFGHLLELRNRLAGFEVQQVHNWIGLELAAIGPRNPQHCPCVTVE